MTCASQELSRTGIRGRERLKRRRLLRGLFSDTSGSISSGCIRFVYRFVDPSQLPDGVRVQVAFSAPRRLGCAVMRNRAKRIMRASFPSIRPALWELAAVRGQPLTLMVLHRGPVDRPSSDLCDDLVRCARLLTQRLAGRTPPP